MAIEKGLNCCLFAVSKMYVCTTNESCPSLQSRFGAIAKTSEVGLLKTIFMQEENENRSKWIKIRLKPSEEQLLNKRYQKSTFQNLSEFGRAMILGEPVTVIHRDKSMDEVLEELALLRRELNFVGNNLNQAVRNINSAHGFPDKSLWMNLLTVINGKLEPSITQIKEGMNKYADLWSQKLRAGKA
jgi:hypothetical protein